MRNLQEELLNVRHDLHQNPETGFEEHWTSNYISNQLKLLGMEVHNNIGGTGVVAVLKQGTGSRVIGLRADMDALNIKEQASHNYTSRNNGKMHACGHDGHMTMLLGAAKLLSKEKCLNGTVCFVFQPAEEHGKGAKAMIEDSILERFGITEFYGVHNWPGLSLGSIATRAGLLMASEDNFMIRIMAKGGHAARPHMTKDPIVIAAEIILALQTIVSRSIDPADSVVISCTDVVTDGLTNVIPSEVTIKGDTRTNSCTMSKFVEDRMHKICLHICEMNDATCDFAYIPTFAPTINDKDCVEIAAAAAIKTVGSENFTGNIHPVMVSEDFGVFIRHVPGCFAFIGNGSADDEKGSIPLHNPNYDFNDDILLVGARYFEEIVKSRLGT